MAVGVLGGLFVKKEMATHVDACLTHRTVLNTEREDGGDVSPDFCSVVVLAKACIQLGGCSISIRDRCRGIFQCQLRLELILGSNVPLVVDTPVDTDNRCKASTALRAVDNTVSHHRSHLTHSSLSEEICCRHGYDTLWCIHLQTDILDITLIGTAGIDHAQAHGHVQVVCHFIRTCQLCAKIVLTPFHVGVERITCHRTGFQSIGQNGKDGDLALKRTEAIVKLTLAATT